MDGIKILLTVFLLSGCNQLPVYEAMDVIDKMEKKGYKVKSVSMTRDKSYKKVEVDFK